MYLYNAELQEITHVYVSHPLSKIVSNRDGTLLGACNCNNKVMIMSPKLEIISSCQSASEVCSLVFGALGRDVEPCDKTLVYSNKTHIGYLTSKNGLSGIITSLNRQVYLKKIIG